MSVGANIDGPDAAGFLDGADAFRYLFDESPCPMSVQGPDFKLLAVNKAYCDYVGFSPDYLIGLDPIVLMPVSARPGVLRERAMKSEETLATTPLLRSVVFANGRVGTFRLYVKPIKLGTLETGYITTFFPIEEQFGEAPRVELWSERFRRLFDQAPVGLVITNLDGRLQRANVEFLRLIGMTPKELIAAGPLFGAQSSSSVSASPSAKPGADVIEGGESRHHRELWQRPDGQSIWIDRVTQTIELFDGSQALLTVVSNVTREMQAYSQLQSAMNEYRVLLDATAAGVLKLQRGRINRVNQSLESMFRMRAVDVLGRTPVRAFASRREFRTMLAATHRVLASGGQYAAECRLRRADGQFIDCEIQCRRVIDSDAHAGIIVTVHDITDLRAQERGRMQAAAAQHKVLIREIHHRIKNNLQGVAGLIQSLAARRPDLSEVLSGVAGQIRAMGQVYGLQQIDDMGSLAVDRVVQSIIASMPYPFSAITLEPPEADAQGMAWRLPEQEVIPFALIINELLTNAFKHGDAAPDVRVRLRSGPSGCEVIISNAARPGANANIEAGHTLDSGLGLVRAMMPSRAADLDLQTIGGRVMARLSIQYPAVVLLGQKNENRPPVHESDTTLRV